MTEFRLTQISDTHLTRNFAVLTDNFYRVGEHIDAHRPDLVINTGDVSWDGPSSRADMEFAKELHGMLPVDCRYLPGNHDIGDNPTAVGAAPSCPATEELRDAFVSVFGEDRWQFEAAGWRFIGLNSLIMNTGIPSELEQEEWLTERLAGANGKPIALFLHKPLFLNTPEDLEEASTAIRFVPQPVRAGWLLCLMRTMSGLSRAAMCISAAISLTRIPGTSGHRLSDSSFQTGCRM